MRFWKKGGKPDGSRAGKGGGSSGVGEEPDQDEITSKLNGRTLMVYFFLLNAKSVGVRDLQRQLGLSSPSVAQYHLDKLVDLKIVENINGVYHVRKKVDIPALSSWIMIGSRLLPRFLFAAIFFTSIFCGYLFFFYERWTTDSLFVVMLGASILACCWLEVLWNLKRKPF